MPLVRRTRATLRRAEFGFFGRHGVHAGAHAAPLGRALQGRRLVFSGLVCGPCGPAAGSWARRYLGRSFVGLLWGTEGTRRPRPGAEAMLGAPALTTTPPVGGSLERALAVGGHVDDPVVRRRRRLRPLAGRLLEAPVRVDVARRVAGDRPRLGVSRLATTAEAAAGPSSDRLQGLISDAGSPPRRRRRRLGSAAFVDHHREQAQARARLRGVAPWVTSAPSTSGAGSRCRPPS